LVGGAGAPAPAATEGLGILATLVRAEL
jgi:hypothetical protein